MRRFHEENSKEAGEHFTPRDAVQLMAKLVFLPVANEIGDGTYLLYDGASGTGPMLTVAEDVLQRVPDERSKQVSTHLYGQEINAEKYAMCKADLLLKGEGEAADNTAGSSEHRLRSHLQPILLHARAYADAGGNPGRHSAVEEETAGLLAGILPTRGERDEGQTTGVSCSGRSKW